VELAEPINSGRDDLFLEGKQGRQMEDIIRGSVWKFGNNIDTDAIAPGEYLDAPPEEVAQHVFENIEPGFATTVKKGDIIVAGGNFGCGSSRENAPSAIKDVGIACIVAESFGRIFFRNAIAIGLPVVICDNVGDLCEKGHIVEISFSDARINNVTTGESLTGESLSDEMRTILEKGGILEYLKEIYFN
jgi:3-isopropylmalate/(R)-2-methylmalate dehydratase small subunit